MLNSPAQTEKQRLLWVDGMRALCILTVFFVHDGLSGGPILPVIGLACGVPGFFFISGLFAERSRDEALPDYILTRCRQLLIPYAIYTVASLLLCGLMDPTIYARLGTELLNILLARRNHLFSAAAWFLPCLFVVNCLYHLMQRFIPRVWLRLALAAVISFLARMFLEEPMLPFSANAALRYLIYYALGDALSPVLSGRREHSLISRLRLIMGISGCVVFVLFAAFGVYDRLLQAAGTHRPLILLWNFLFALSGFAVFALLGQLLSHLPFVTFAGRSTLIFCGTESLARPLLARLLALFGIGLAPGSALGRIFLNGLVLAFICVIFALPIQRFTPWLAGKKYTLRKNTN